MKRLLMLAVLLSTAAQAATGVMTSNVNLRRTASATGTVLTMIPEGTSLTVACTGSCCRTTYKGQSGYVAKSLVRMQTATTSLSTPPSRPSGRTWCTPTARRPKPRTRDNDGVACE